MILCSVVHAETHNGASSVSRNLLIVKVFVGYCWRLLFEQTTLLKPFQKAQTF